MSVVQATAVVLLTVTGAALPAASPTLAVAA